MMQNKKCLVMTIAAVVIAVATVQDIKHKGLLYQALPKSLQAGLHIPKKD